MIRTAVCTIVAGVFVLVGAGERRQSALTGLAVLPADTFAPGPPSGAFMTGGMRAATPPFSSQPVQGLSSIWPAGDGWFWALSDNGFGTRLNSPDYLLRIYRVRPRWRERGGGDGRVDVDPGFVQIADPDRLVPFRVVNEGTPGRALTGADFDLESLVRGADGTFWIGDEFGPFLLHADATGRLVDAPIEAPGLRSPDHPLVTPAGPGVASEATAGRSRGFEGLGAPPGTSRLLALLEAPGGQAPRAETEILEFDLASRRWTGRRWLYPFDPQGVAATELVCDRIDRCLVIERDNEHGPRARFKRVFAVHLPEGGGPVRKTPVLDLLDIADPDDLAGAGSRFTFPFITTEAMWPIDEVTLVLVNDNNFPATGGRHEDVRDETEFIRVRVGVSLDGAEPPR